MREPSIGAEQWSEMHADGYVASTIKGNPDRTHARKQGENVALCGKKPGPSPNTFRMRKRTGWMYFTDGRAPNCDACGKAAAAFPSLGSDAHLKRALQSGD